ncbi:MAG: RNA chaperone Hfq [Armatimonadetes bacterium]|nr:RNA chaperone Hfq [Candidatus Hippobium faecium]
MKQQNVNLQDSFLNLARKDNIPVTIFLVSGIQLKGTVKGFDQFIVILESQGRPWQMVYKHAIATVVPGAPIKGLFDNKDEEETAPAEE